MLKSGDRSNLENQINQNPIGSLKNFGKYAHCQLKDHHEIHKLLSCFQFGFRKHHSTELATAFFNDEIQKAKDNGMLTGAIYIDLRKAFDTISYTLSIEKNFMTLALQKFHSNKLEITCLIAESKYI